MGLWVVFVLFIVGLILIVKGGDIFVEAAAWIAEVSGIPKFLIGATIVSLATTLPELLVSLLASAYGKVDIAIGNAVGSVSVNAGFILALAIVFLPCAVKMEHFRAKAVLMVIAALVLLIFTQTGELGLFPSVLLLILFAVFVWENIRSARRDIGTGKKREYRREELVPNLLNFAIGTACIVIGAHLLVENGSLLALAMGVSEGVVGVTFIAVGTSLPELITAITAVRKKQTSISVGNIIGANVIDLTLILPLCTVISGKPLPVSQQSAMLDLPACLLILLVTVIPALALKKFTRAQGAVLIALYAGYILLLISLLG